VVFAGIGGMIAAQVVFTHAPFMNRLFHTAPIGPAEWLRSLAVGATVFAIVEFEKWVRWRLNPAGAGRA
jgi:cation-transporting P-type ATPase F